MKKKKLPLFRFTLSNQLGIALISEGIIYDSNGNLIEDTKKYDLAKDCNGNHIYPSIKPNAKPKATIKKQAAIGVGKQGRNGGKKQKN